MGKVSCTICNKRCRGTVLKIEDNYFHKACFKCNKCGKPLDEQNFQFRDRSLFCPEDYRQEYAIKCAACGSPVEGDVVTALGNTFHTFCLRCFSCNRTIVSGEKTVALNNRFYCEKCVPPQVPRDESMHNHFNNESPSKEPQSESSEKSPSKSKTPKSSSLPRRFGDIFRSKKSRSQTLQPNNRNLKTEDIDTSSKNTTLSNGTGVLRVDVDEKDLATTDSGILKKFEQEQSPSYSLYSGEDALLAKRQQEMQAAPAEGYPMSHSMSATTAGGVPYSLDPALTTPSMINTLSGDTSTLLYGSVRRICPPGVDYGHQYPISYLRLAEQGYTAITSSDLLSSHSPLSSTTPNSVRRPPTSTSGLTHQRLSRRDMPPIHQSQARTLPTTSADVIPRQNGGSGYMDIRYAPQVFGETDGGRPEKDRYARYRQLSPAGSSLGRAVSSGRGPNFLIGKSQTYSSYSTPNVNSRRAETMMRSPPRSGRSMSPEAALSAQAEARRLAAYPGAKIPDVNSEPAIDRYDWPAPPSPAVVMIDRRREKAMKSGTLPDAKITTKSDETDESDTQTLSPGTAHSMTPEKDEIATTVSTSLESRISTLKRTTGNSGMSAAIAEYVEEEEKRQRDSSPDLDPVSASRSPSANFEPPYSTRYTNHRFACRREKTFDSLRSIARASRSITTLVPRPGYTSGILSSRPVSLPRGVNGNAIAPTGWSSTLSPAQRKIYASNTSRPLPINGGPAPLNGSRDGALSLTTSGLSMDGITGLAEPQTMPPLTTMAGTARATHRARSTTLTGGLPPPSISGLRPTGRRSYNYLSGGVIPMEYSRGRPPLATTNGWRTLRTSSENNRRSAMAADESARLLDEEYPDVQSWLKPPSTLHSPEPKTYPYAQLKVSADVKLKGIDNRRREDYLSSEDFEELFKMPRTAFQRLPEWKKSDLKRRLDLY
ncbi:unnamed protein product [Hymenolepis diminuta]|uniref:LIM zinc-binding domain-containing protein n=1 Tax=Hymenolepis diminuta TaxID=6216 RepID=A0A564Z532_HYMDI|nr:unnamed protein product [Hymenolepis diminuta]